MEYQAKYEFVTGETLNIEVVDKHIAEAIEKMEQYAKRHEHTETRRHEGYFEGYTEETYECIWQNGHVLTPEQAFFHKLWVAEQTERLKRLRRVLRKLTKLQHKLIRQFYYKNMTAADIAREEKCDISGVCKKHKRVLKFLRKQF
jgi:DNA-directed RNA polymerase specialized sigma24 family protein